GADARRGQGRVTIIASIRVVSSTRRIPGVERAPGLAQGAEIGAEGAGGEDLRFGAEEGELREGDGVALEVDADATRALARGQGAEPATIGGRAISGEERRARGGEAQRDRIVRAGLQEIAGPLLPERREDELRWALEALLEQTNRRHPWTPEDPQRGARAHPTARDAVPLRPLEDEPEGRQGTLAGPAFRRAILDEHAPVLEARGAQERQVLGVVGAREPAARIEVQTSLGALGRGALERRQRRGELPEGPPEGVREAEAGEGEGRGERRQGRHLVVVEARHLRRPGPGEPDASPRPPLRDDRHAARRQRVEVPIDGPPGDLELLGAALRRQTTPGLEEQEQTKQPSRTHPWK